MHRLLVIVMLVGAGASGCGAAAAPERAPPTVAATPARAPARRPPVEEEKAKEEIQVQGELGTLEQDQIDAVFNGKRAAVAACYDAGLAELWYLGGTLELKLRVARDGAVKSAQTVRSLGSWAVDRCLVGVGRGLRFPPPRGHAEAEVTYPLRFRGKATLKEWGRAEVGRVFAAHQKALDACAHAGNVPPALRVTLFVGPGGRVGAAGLGADGPIEDKYGECVVREVGRWKFADPRGRIARATYEFQ